MAFVKGLCGCGLLFLVGLWDQTGPAWEDIWALVHSDLVSIPLSA